MTAAPVAAWQAGRVRVVAVMRDPLLRSGHLLILSSTLTGVLGLVFWSFAAHHYRPALVGQASVAVAVLNLLGAVAQLNLMGALLRFVPTQGGRAGRLIAGSYAVSVGIAGMLGLGFVLVAGSVSSNFGFFRSPAVSVTFLLCALLWPVSVLQDSALTALRRPGWVVAENLILAGVKVALIVVLAAVVPAAGIVGSWALALVASVVVANGFLFGRALPGRAPDPATEPLALGTLARFVAPDYGASLFQQAAVAGLPLLVVAMVGDVGNAYFAVAWNLAYALYLVSTNMGYSLVVESARDEQTVVANLFRVIRHLMPPVCAAVAVLTVGAPVLLGLFGTDYARHGLTVLRLLALSAIPNVLNCSACNVARVCRRTTVSLAVNATTCILVVGLSLALLPVMGIDGVALAWLVSQTVVSLGLIGCRRAWLPGWAAKAGPDLSGFHRFVVPAVRELKALGVSGDGSPFRLQPVPVLNDLPAVVIHGRAGPVGVLKRGGTPAADDQLMRECRAITAVRADPRCAALQGLLPAASCVRDPGGAFSVQTWLPGINGEELVAGDPLAAPRLAAAALGWVRQLSAASGADIVVDGERLATWVDEPVARVSAARDLLSPGAVRRAAGVQAELHRRLGGRRVRVAWSHGDLWLGNLLYARGDRLVGVVDWADGRQGVVGVDACHLALMTWARMTGRTLGAVVVRALRAGGWTRLAAGTVGVPGDLLWDGSGNGVTERTVILLTWLQHVSTVLTKNQRERSSPVWLAANVDRVLWESARRLDRDQAG